MSASVVLSRDYHGHGAQQPSQQQQQLLHQQGPLPAVRAYMLIEDDVHGVIELPTHIQEIVEHPLFQRLKKIHQLGLVPWVIAPQANHKRYDHCLGTYKSAQDHLRAIERNSKYEAKLPDWCRKAVEIAALLHDIGHGPMSHVWERVCQQHFDHEENALDCVDRIFKDARHSELVALRDKGSGRGVQLNAAAEQIFVDLVQRLAPQVVDLRSNDAGWLNLYDDHILKLIENDAMAAYFREPQRVVELPSVDGSGADVLPISRIIEGPGCVMKPDKAFAFYGDKRKKRQINRCLSATTFNKCYTLE
ncbi:deoxynucleoside triphosphate triphosphohydrolase SAMHD1 isoform X3 [Drosophila obscura]|uniref:deoxynucleoside triphosphate triphosphohydrolase SAMHD1 isoform X3 n=1 Tax=Drosophila obscura TaxID=7282 RepID=UPI001BB1B7F2|nr:deoxynucleoside triphosphate triphosphohydrolase SAMHD1 isoform X3 [Drosophila obscura]